MPIDRGDKARSASIDLLFSGQASICPRGLPASRAILNTSTNEDGLNITQRKIVQTIDPYKIQEVTDKDGRILWEIWGPKGFLGDHVSLADAEAEMKDAIESPLSFGNRPSDG